MAEMKIVTKKLDEIYPYENNARRNERAIDAVARSIEEFGFLKPIVIDKNGVIIAGHTRYAALQKLGYTEAECYVADKLTEEQAKAFRLADNRIAEMAEWDEDKLAEEIKKIEEYDLFDFGFTETMLQEAFLEQFEHKCPKCGHIWTE